jgi:predicted alpha/beta-hydrolase family hydrolase
MSRGGYVEIPPLAHDVDWPARKIGMDRAVLLAHGAGSDRNGTALTATAARLAAAGIPTLRFDYPYRTAGRNAPDRPAVLEAATRAAVALAAEATELSADQLVLGGRSMGGRYCSMVAGAEDDPVPCRGLVLLSYPLHPAGKPGQLRTAHFPRLRMPVLFISGTRDSLAGRDALEAAAKAIPGAVEFHWIDDADHSYRVPKRTGRDPADVLAEVAERAATWVAALP